MGEGNEARPKELVGPRLDGMSREMAIVCHRRNQQQIMVSGRFRGENRRSNILPILYLSFPQPCLFKFWFV